MTLFVATMNGRQRAALRRYADARLRKWISGDVIRAPGAFAAWASLYDAREAASQERDRRAVVDIGKLSMRALKQALRERNT